MLVLKQISKKAVTSIVLFSLILNLYLLTVSSFKIFEDYRANSIFARFNIFANTFLVMVLLLIAFIKFYKILKKIEVQNLEKRSLELTLRRKNLALFLKMIFLILPILIFCLVKFFEFDKDFNWNVTILVMASIALATIVVIIALFFTYKFIKKVSLLDGYTGDLKNAVEGLYSSSVFLDILNYDQENYSYELKQEIQIFLSSKNEENHISFNKILADFLDETKKATTPPSLR